VARLVQGRATDRGGKAADVATGGDLLAQALDLVMLGGQPGARQSLELGQLRDLLVTFGEPLFQLGVVRLEPFDLRDAGVDDLSGVLELLHPPLELLGQVLVGAGPGGAVSVLLGIEGGAQSDSSTKSAGRESSPRATRIARSPSR
jgi:hypothetical protein